MNTRLTTWLTALTVLAVLAFPGRVTAQQHADARYPYILIDLGTFGGPDSSIPGRFPFAVALNNLGMVAGAADTPMPDPNAPNNCFFGDCFVGHAFLWQHAVRTDLGVLPSGGRADPQPPCFTCPWSSTATAISPNGLVEGYSENGLVDPLTGSPELRAVLWRHGTITDLGTFGGTASEANAVNDSGQVVGGALNATPDPFAMIFAFGPEPLIFGAATQEHAFRWQDGVKRDLGTLGGSDSTAGYVNERGQVAGYASTSAISHSITGLPPVDPFLWTDGHMQDLGTLGGDYGWPNDLNNSGEVVGVSNLAADQAAHPFLWDGHTMRDLGTFGGTNGFANSLNDAGVVVGQANETGDQVSHAFLWRRGVMLDLGTPSGAVCTNAQGVNAWDQVVGFSSAAGSSQCTGQQRGWLWQHGSIVDVNTLVRPGAAVTVTDAININDRGEIAGLGMLANGNQHAVLLIPADLAASEGLTSNAPAPGTTAPAIAVQRSPATCMRGPAWLRRPIPAYRPRSC